MERCLEIGAGRVAHCSGALWLPAERVLLVADAHLGYGWAQRRRGELGPVGDGGIGAVLREVVSEFGAEEVLFLGDTVHAPKPTVQERHVVEQVLADLLAVARVSVVEGNHDRAFARDFGQLPIAVERQRRYGDLLALHGDKLDRELPEAAYYVMGHLHPAIGLRDHAGARRRVPAFLIGERATVLPAFSPFAGGFDVSREALPEPLRPLLGRYRVAVVTGRQVAEVPLRAR